MASNIFVNTYQLYKKQTDKLAQWLVDNAQACGYEIPEPERQDPKALKSLDSNLDDASSPASAPSPTPSRRLKGRARKEAKLKKASTDIAPAEGLKSEAVYRIGLSQFTILAEKIAQARSKVPDTIIKLARQVVDLRRGFSKFYDQHATDATRMACLKHAHFVSTLEKVIDILQPPSATAEASTDTGLRQPNQTTLSSQTNGIANGGISNALSNRFDDLELEEPVEIDEGFKESIRQVSSADATPRNVDQQAVRRVKYQSDNAQDNEEKYFAMHCLFSDLQDLRTFIGKAWEDYSNGRLDLMTASVLTNTAFDLVRRTEDSFFSAYPEFESAQKLIQVFMVFICILRGANPDHKQQPDDWFNYDVADVAQWLYLPTFILLDGFCDVIQPRHMPLMKPGFFGTYNAKADRDTMSLRQRLAEDKIILLEALPEFCLFGDSKVRYPGEDEMTKGLRDMYKTKKIPLFLCFATQIYLDITHIRRDSIGTSFRELQALSYEAKKTLNTALALPHSAVWPEENDKILRNTVSFIDYWIIEDAIDKMRRVLLKSMYGKGITEPYYLFRRHPLLCGLLQFSLTMMMREAGSAMALCWGSILYVGHLYNALRQTANLDIMWPDMETFISVNTPERLFVGGLPTKLEDCFKRYSLMLGTAPETFARDYRARNRGQTLSHSKKGPRDWHVDPPIVKIFKERYLDLDGSVRWSLNNVEALVKEANLDAAKKRWQSSHQLSPIHLLTALQIAMAEELPELTYDYFGMHFKCIKLLRELRSENHDKLLQYFGPGYLEREDQISTVAGYIIMVAVNSSKVGEALVGETGGSQMLIKAGKVLTTFIEADKDQSSGLGISLGT